MRRFTNPSVGALLVALAVHLDASAAMSFRTPLAAEDLDPAAFTQWVDGTESPLKYRDGPRHVVWTSNSRPEWDGVRFSDSKTTAPRHLRIGWRREVPVGTVLARGGGRVSVLKSSATYPGDVSDDTQWIAAERIAHRRVSTAAIDKEGLAFWVLPPETRTRAVRFTHTPVFTEKSYAGYLGATWILTQRLANLGAQAKALTTRNPEHAGKINNESNDGTWGAWDNGGAPVPLSSTNYEPLTLVWSRRVELAGLCAIWGGLKTCDVMAYTGKPSRHPREALPGDWEKVGSFDGMECGYPLQLWPNWISFDRTVTTRAIQLRITATTHEGHPHMNGRTKGGAFTWMGELFAIADLGGKKLATAVLPDEAAPDLGHPPIPVRFTLRDPGYVTLVIDDANGKRVRNLVSATPFRAGRNTVWWDGMDDHGRDLEAARHGLYHIPAAFVEPGTYTVRGLVREELELRFEFACYNGGSPAWTTEDHTGGWTTNHTPPRCVAAVPAGRAPGDDAMVYIGSYVAEGGDGLAWVDLDGKKRGGRHWIGGNWTGAKLVAYDPGPDRDGEIAVYVASDWEGELRLCAMKRDNNVRDIVKWKYPDKTTQSLTSLAVFDRLVVCTLPKTNELLFIEATMGRVLSSMSCENTTAVAFDDSGDLYALREKQLVRARIPEDALARLDGKRLDRSKWSIRTNENEGAVAAAVDGRENTRWETRRSMKPGDFFTIDLGETTDLARIDMLCGGDWPRGYEVHVSLDGQSWGDPIATGGGTHGLTSISFATTRGRHVKIVQTRADGPWWSINEINVFEPSSGDLELVWLPVIREGLEDPQQICFDRWRNIYISDRGESHQIKVFDSTGGRIREIGAPGAPEPGPYDKNHMNNPQGIAIDSRDQLWVAEQEFQPKRVSVWALDGRLLKAFYGPAEYGGGGTLDPKDRTRFYYRGLEFELDWETGTDTLKTILFRHGKDELLPPDGWGSNGAPETPHYVDGRRYFSNWADCNPTNGAGIASIWADRGGIARPAAAAGAVRNWTRLNRVLGAEQQFSVRWTGKVTAPESGEWTFYTISDDGVRLWVDDKMLIDNWTDHGHTEDAGRVRLVGGQETDIRLEYYQGGGGAVTRLSWSGPGQAKVIIPSSCLTPVDATEPGGLTGEYHRGKDLRELGMKRVDASINFDWPEGKVSFGDSPEKAAMLARMPAGVKGGDSLFFIWSDLNRDEKLEPEEVQFIKGGSGSVTVSPDLTLVVSRIDGNTTTFAPVRYEGDVPVYDIDSGTVTAREVFGPASSGGDQAIVTGDGWTVLSLGLKPFAQHSITGVRNGEPMWSYPNVWPGLHAAHEAPAPSFPGMLIGPTRMLGWAFDPPGSTTGPLWAINGNMGEMYVFTADGLFVDALFKDVRQGWPWSMPVAERNMKLNDVSPHDENFWPTITLSSDGKVYVIDGARSSIIRVDNMDSLRRLPEASLQVRKSDLDKARAYQMERELARQKALGTGILKVAIRGQSPSIDGKLDEWKAAEFATIDKRGVAAYFDSNTRPYNVAAAVSVDDSNLYVAWRTTEDKLLRNSGEIANAPFKTGGCLDVMIGTDPKALDGRRDPVEGDLRLLVTRVKGKTLALVYRPKVPGTRDPVPFSSPWRTINIDRVDNVSHEVRLAQDGANYEIAVPLQTLGLEPRPDMVIRADVGVLRGDGMQTFQRVYWTNKGTAITSDVPSEAMLTPALWGKWRFARE